jgi:hypothetical protein
MLTRQTFDFPFCSSQTFDFPPFMVIANQSTPFMALATYTFLINFVFWKILKRFELDFVQARDKMLSSSFFVDHLVWNDKVKHKSLFVDSGNSANFVENLCVKLEVNLPNVSSLLTKSNADWPSLWISYKLWFWMLSPWCVLHPIPNLMCVALNQIWEIIQKSYSPGSDRLSSFRLFWFIPVRTPDRIHSSVNWLGMRDHNSNRFCVQIFLIILISCV